MIVGLTGGIGTGKSTVAKILMEKGYPIIDTDIIAREIIDDIKVIENIKNKISKDIITNEKVDRKKLSQIVFKDEKKLDILNSIMHPAILNKMWEQINEVKDKYSLVIADVPLLFEINIEKDFDVILLVAASKETQLERILLRDNRTKEQALQIINSQMDLDIKRKKSNYVIENNGTMEELKNKVNEIVKILEGL